MSKKTGHFSVRTDRYQGEKVIPHIFGLSSSTRNVKNVFFDFFSFFAPVQSSSQPLAGPLAKGWRILKGIKKIFRSWRTARFFDNSVSPFPLGFSCFSDAQPEFFVCSRSRFGAEFGNRVWTEEGTFRSWFSSRNWQPRWNCLSLLNCHWGLYPPTQISTQKEFRVFTLELGTPQTVEVENNLPLSWESQPVKSQPVHIC